MSPVTKAIDELEPMRSILGVGMLSGIASAFPNFNIKDVLTPVGEKRVNLFVDVGGCSVTSLTLLMDGQPLLQPNWAENPFVQRYQSENTNGGKKIEDPLLVIHGDGNVELTTKAVHMTKELFPSSRIEYFRLSGMCRC